MFVILNYKTNAVKVTNQDTDQVIGSVTLAALVAYCKTPRSRREIQAYCRLRGRTNFRIKYLRPLLDKDKFKANVPEKPNSRYQKNIHNI